MKENSEMKWHQNPTIIILMLIIFFPFGIYFMWKNQIWSSKARWIITSIFALGIIGIATDDSTSSTKGSSDQISEKVTHSDVSEKKEISSSHTPVEKTRFAEEAEKKRQEEEMSASSVLVGYDWVYPDMNDPISAWKFSSDGSFNTSQTMFGGSTRRGTWKDLGNGQVELIYDDGGYVVFGDGGSSNVSSRGTITILSKSKFKVGSTIYRRY